MKFNLYAAHGLRMNITRNALEIVELMYVERGLRKLVLKLLIEIDSN